MKTSSSYINVCYVTVVIVLLCIILPFSAQAETVVRTGDSVSISVNQVVENDLYAAGGSVTHSGEVKEDIYVAAGSITVNGGVGEDLTAIGGTIQVNSLVEDDLRAVGGEVVISGEVKGDVFVIGGLLRILSSATIDGNVYFYGKEAEIEGVVSGEVMGSAESFSLNSEVGGMNVSVMKLKLGEAANVRGDLAYSSVRDMDRAAGAVVGGEVIRGAVSEREEGAGNASLVFLFSWIFASLCLFLLMRSPLESLLSDIKEDPAKAGLIGLAIAFGAPVFCFVLLATVLGAWIGLAALLVTSLLFLVTLLALPIILGGYISSFIRKGRRLDLYAVAIGVALVVITTHIPVIGGLLLLVAFMVVIGSIAQAIYQKARNII